MKLTKEDARTILDVWDELDPEDEMSTERLLAMTADIAGTRIGKELDSAIVVDVLAADQVKAT